MNDLIIRNWLMECVEEGWIKFDTKEDENKFIHLVRDIAPSAQPEIIHCKDCKHREHDEHYGYMCDLDTGDPYELGRCAEDDDWFCADSERRED